MKKSLRLQALFTTVAISLVPLQSTSTLAATAVINGGDAAVAANPNATPAISFLTDHIATVNNGINVTGAITNDSGVAGRGSLYLSGTNILTGDIGAVGAELKIVRINATNVTINGDIYTSGPNGLYFAGGHTVTLNGDLNGYSDIGNGGTLNLGNGYTIDSHIWSGNPGSGTVNITGDATWVSSTLDPTRATSSLHTVAFKNAGIVSLGVNLDADNISFQNTTETTLASNITMKARTGTGNTAMTVQNSATLDVNQRTLAVTGTVNFAAGTTLNIMTTGAITSTGNATVNANTNVHVTVPSGANIANGQSFTLINSQTTGGLVSALAANKLTSSSTLITFEQDTSNDDDLVVTASRQTYSQYAGITTGPELHLANALNELAYNGTATGGMATTLATLDGYTQQQLASAISTMTPARATTAVEPAIHATILGAETVSDRMASMRTGSISGISAGSLPLDRAVWVKTFGSVGEQDNNGSFDGYTADTGGLTVGADKEFEQGRLGVAGSFSSTNVNVGGSHPNDGTDILSYRAALYGTKDIGAAYIDGQVFYTFHDYDGSRQAGVGTTAHASYTGSELGVILGSGYRYKLQDSFFVTPYAVLALSHFHQNDYTETGAGVLNMSFDDNNMSRARSTLGTRMSKELNLDGKTVIPEAHVAWNHELADVLTESTSAFTGGGAAFVTPGQSIARNSFNVGAAVTLVTSDELKLTASYDYEGRDGYDGNGIQLTARMPF